MKFLNRIFSLVGLSQTFYFSHDNKEHYRFEGYIDGFSLQQKKNFTSLQLAFDVGLKKKFMIFSQSFLLLNRSKKSLFSTRNFFLYSFLFKNGLSFDNKNSADILSNTSLYMSYSFNNLYRRFLYQIDFDKNFFPSIADNSYDNIVTCKDLCFPILKLVSNFQNTSSFFFTSLDSSSPKTFDGFRWRKKIQGLKNSFMDMSFQMFFLERLFYWDTFSFNLVTFEFGKLYSFIYYNIKQYSSLKSFFALAPFKSSNIIYLFQFLIKLNCYPLLFLLCSLILKGSRFLNQNNSFLEESPFFILSYLNFLNYKNRPKRFLSFYSSKNNYSYYYNKPFVLRFGYFIRRYKNPVHHLTSFSPSPKKINLKIGFRKKHFRFQRHFDFLKKRKLFGFVGKHRNPPILLLNYYFNYFKLNIHLKNKKNKCFPTSRFNKKKSYFFYKNKKNRRNYSLSGYKRFFSRSSFSLKRSLIYFLKSILSTMIKSSFMSIFDFSISKLKNILIVFFRIRKYFSLSIFRKKNFTNNFFSNSFLNLNKTPQNLKYNKPRLIGIPSKFRLHFLRLLCLKRSIRNKRRKKIYKKFLKIYKKLNYILDNHVLLIKFMSFDFLRYLNFKVRKTSYKKAKNLTFFISDQLKEFNSNYIKKFSHFSFNKESSSFDFSFFSKALLRRKFSLSFYKKNNDLSFFLRLWFSKGFFFKSDRTFLYFKLINFLKMSLRKEKRPVLKRLYIKSYWFLSRITLRKKNIYLQSLSNLYFNFLTSLNVAVSSYIWNKECKLNKVIQYFVIFFKYFKIKKFFYSVWTPLGFDHSLNRSTKKIVHKSFFLKKKKSINSFDSKKLFMFMLTRYTEFPKTRFRSFSSSPKPDDIHGLLWFIMSRSLLPYFENNLFKSYLLTSSKYQTFFFNSFTYFFCYFIYSYRFSEYLNNLSLSLFSIKNIKYFIFFELKHYNLLLNYNFFWNCSKVFVPSFQDFILKVDILTFILLKTNLNVLRVWKYNQFLKSRYNRNTKNHLLLKFSRKVTRANTFKSFIFFRRAFFSKKFLFFNLYSSAKSNIKYQPSIYLSFLFSKKLWFFYYFNKFKNTYNLLKDFFIHKLSNYCFSFLNLTHSRSTLSFSSKKFQVKNYKFVYEMIFNNSSRFLKYYNFLFDSFLRKFVLGSNSFTFWTKSFGWSLLNFSKKSLINKNGFFYDLLYILVLFKVKKMFKKKFFSFCMENFDRSLWLVNLFIEHIAMKFLPVVNFFDYHDIVDSTSAFNNFIDYYTYPLIYLDHSKYGWTPQKKNYVENIFWVSCRKNQLEKTFDSFLFFSKVLFERSFRNKKNDLFISTFLKFCFVFRDFFIKLNKNSSFLCNTFYFFFYRKKSFSSFVIQDFFYTHQMKKFKSLYFNKQFNYFGDHEDC